MFTEAVEQHQTELWTGNLTCNHVQTELWTVNCSLIAVHSVSVRLIEKSHRCTFVFSLPFILKGAASQLNGLKN